MRSSKFLLWLLMLSAAYASAQLLWYWQTPLGQMPALDGQENLIIAGQINDGSLPAEPYYRAILYPAILAFIPIHWMLLGLLCHIANTWLCIRLARKVWRERYSALTTGILVGFNPVLLHFAFDPLDITLALTLFLLAIELASRRQDWDDNARGISHWLPLAGSGLALALAVLARPHFFALLAPAIVAAAALALFRKANRTQAAAFAIAAVLPLLAFGFHQASRNGSFKILPTQGAYNLWASNRPGANGLYLTQSLNFHYIGEHQNPTRMESETLYQQETGEKGTIEERSLYWKNKTFDHIRSNPLDWIKLMAFKTYAWINDYEQYNNKTYSFHKSLSPWLRYNPIGWGLIISLAAIGLFRMTPRNRSWIWSGLAIVALYSAGALIYMASARFRLPLVPLFAVAAGGFPLVVRDWKTLSNQTRTTVSFTAALVVILTFSRFSSIANPTTIQQDTLLIADTASRIGNDFDAYRWADKTLELNPNRQDARRLRLLSFYNLVSIGKSGQTGKSWQDFAEDLDRINLQDPYIQFAKGVAYWNLGQPETAAKIWRSNFDQHQWTASSSLAALIHTHSELPSELSSFPADVQRADPILIYVLNQPEQQDLKRKIDFHFNGSPELFQTIGYSLSLVLPPQPTPSAS